MNRLFLLELNEFNADALREGARAFGLANLKWALDFSESRTRTDVTKSRARFSAVKALGLVAEQALKCRWRTVFGMLRELPAMLAATFAFCDVLPAFSMFFEYFSALLFLVAARLFGSRFDTVPSREPHRRLLRDS